MPLFLDEDQKRKVLSAIDHGAWQYSWHLPKDDYGYIAWNDETYAECLKILARKRDEHVAFAAKCAELANLIADVVKDRARNAEE